MRSNKNLDTLHNHISGYYKKIGMLWYKNEWGELNKKV